MDEKRLDALAASLARTDGRPRSTARLLGRWLLGSRTEPEAQTAHPEAQTAHREPLTARDGMADAIPDLSRRRMLIRGAAAAGAAVWIPPVIESIAAPAAAGIGSPPPNCLPNGQGCSIPGDCCSNSCISGVCASQCSPSQDPCGVDGDCCLGHCETGTCCNNSGKTSANACVDDTDCCNFHTCGTDSFCCTPSQGGCTDNGECCLGHCETGTCCNLDDDPCTQDSDCCNQHVCDTGSNVCVAP